MSTRHLAFSVLAGMLLTSPAVALDGVYGGLWIARDSIVGGRASHVLYLPQTRPSPATDLFALAAISRLQFACDEGRAPAFSVFIKQSAPNPAPTTISYSIDGARSQNASIRWDSVSREAVLTGFDVVRFWRETTNAKAVAFTVSGATVTFDLTGAAEALSDLEELCTRTPKPILPDR